MLKLSQQIHREILFLNFETGHLHPLSLPSHHVHAADGLPGSSVHPQSAWH